MAKTKIEQFSIPDANALLLKIFELNQRSAEGDRSLGLEEEWADVEEKLCELKVLEDLQKFRETNEIEVKWETTSPPSIPNYLAERLATVYH